MAVSAALRAALKWGAEELEELADEFLDHKVFTYVETLADLFTAHGVELSPDEIDLPDTVLIALKLEAYDHAQHVVNTFNDDVDKWLDRAGALDRETLLADYEAWAQDRADMKAPVIAVTEAYNAHADATMAFYGVNRPEDAEPAFDFGGHGDDDPACATCKALQASSPHPLSRVLEIGSPHINCRQEWHPTADVVLPDELRMPEGPAGIVGREALVTRTGGHDQALAELEGLTGSSGTLDE